MATQPAPHVPPPRPTEIRLYSHSTLFYWWPVWVMGFILAVLTYFGHEYMVIVPGDAETSRDWDVQVDKDTRQKREGILLKHETNEEKQHHLAPGPKDEKDWKEKKPEVKLHSTSRKGYGVLFTVVLLVVVFITNVPLRGMLSLMIIMLIILLSIIFALAGIWDRILATISLLDIRINMAGYVFISSGLLALWLLAFFFFDRQVYITFMPGQLKVCLEIGSGEKTYDTIGMTIEKERSDLFRHWILGMGSGDLVVRTAGADRHEFRLFNVLFVSRKLHMIEEMQRVRQERQS